MDYLFLLKYLYSVFVYAVHEYFLVRNPCICTLKNNVFFYRLELFFLKDCKWISFV